MISISYLSKTKIIYVFCEGTIDLNQLIGSVDSLDKNLKDYKNPKIIFDYRNAILSFNQNLIAIDIHKLRDHVASKMKNYTKVDHAVVVNELNNKTVNMFYMEISKIIKNYTFKIFSDIEAAESWLVNN